MSNKIKEVISKSAEKTKKIAANFAQKLSGGEILALSGNLGSGKTTFVQGLAQGLGIKEKITSPSFVIIKNYPLKSKTYKLKPKNLIHIDLYRIKKIDQNLKNQILENFSPQNICVIEWAEKAKKILPFKTQWIKFQLISKNFRKIIFE